MRASPATGDAQMASGAVAFQLGLIAAPTSPATGGAQTASGAAVTQVGPANDSSEDPHGPENNDLQDLLDSDDEDLAMLSTKGAPQQAKRPRSGDLLHSTAPMEHELSQEVRPGLGYAARARTRAYEKLRAAYEKLRAA